MARKIKKIAPRGSVNKIILKTLLNGNKYGYEIIKDIEILTNGSVQLKQPSLYSSLNRFESKGIVNSFWEDSDIGGRRHYYSITDQGKEYYKQLQSDDVDDDGTEPEKENASSLFDIDDVSNDKENGLTKYNQSFSMKDIVDKLINENDVSNNNSVSNSNINISNNNDVSNNNVENKYLLFKPLNTDTLDNAIMNDKYVNNDVYLQNHYSDNNNINKIENLQNKVSDNNDINIIENLQNKVFDNDDKDNNLITDILEDKNITKNNDDTVLNINIIDNPVKISKKEVLDIAFIKYQKFYIKPKKKKKKIVIDQDGIMKLIDDNYKNSSDNLSVIDNVGIRKEFKSFNNLFEKKQMINQSTPKAPQPEQKVVNHDLSDEEKLLQSKQFMEKFDDITQNKINKRIKEEINYKNILGELLSDDDTYEQEKKTSLSPASQMNNSNKNQLEINDDLKTYGNQQINKFDNFELESNENLNSKMFDDLSVEENCKTKNILNDDLFKNNNEIKNKEKNSDIIDEEENQYLESINSVKYSIKSDKNSKKIKNHKIEIDNNNDYEFILYNKSKFVLGFCLMILMYLEIALLHFVFFKLGLMQKYDDILFGISYIVPFLLFVYKGFPYVINHNKRKLQTYNFKYSLIFGFMIFLILSIITYTLCTFVGMDFNNIYYYVVKLSLPIVLSFNLVISQIIYQIIVNCKKFY